MDEIDRQLAKSNPYTQE